MVNLSSLYLSLKRLSEVLPGHVFSLTGGVGDVSEVKTDFMQRLQLINSVEAASITWIKSSGISSLGEHFVKGTLQSGVFFTHYGTFIGKNIERAAILYSEKKPIKDMPVIWTKLDSFSPKASLIMQAHPENYTSSSAPGEMSGKKRLFVVGRITDVSLPDIKAQAYIIGQLHEEAREEGLFYDRFGRLQWHMELYSNLIDNFSMANDQQPTTLQDVERLKAIPEEHIKQAFSEIIGEPFVPKDWGGEKSDLITSRLQINGITVTAAFIFKGPSVFKPLTVADLGKNGDQISRLFSEPADIFILQHCHKVESAVRDHMRAFATRINKLQPFTIIDGVDTFKILKAYHKCGL